MWHGQKIKEKRQRNIWLYHFYSFYVSIFMEFFVFFSCGFKLYRVSLKQGLCINLEGGVGREMRERFRREGIYLYLWLNHVEVWWKTTKFCKVIQFSSVTQSCLTLWDPMNHNTPGLPVHHHLPEFPQTHVHQVGDAIQPTHPLLSPSLPAPNPSHHQSLLQWVNSSHEVAKVLEFQL